MGEVHPEEDSKGRGPTPVKCSQCGKDLTRKTPFMLTANLADINSGFTGILQLQVCDIKCAEAYMEQVKGIIMGTRMGGRQGS